MAIRRIPKNTPSGWLLGTWRSNKARTLESYRWPTENGAKLRETLEREFGKLTMRFTASRVYTSFDGDAGWCSYRVVWQSKSELFIVRGPRSNEDGQHIRFSSPSEFYVPVGNGGYEFFERVQGVA
jgi:hypothetical protein